MSKSDTIILMFRRRLTYLCQLLLFVGAVVAITGCERPDPAQAVEQPTIAASPTSPPATATTIIFPTSEPPQVYVVVVPPGVIEPTAEATRPNTLVVVQDPTLTPTPEAVSLPGTEISTDFEPYYRQNYYLGWASSDVLTVFRNNVFANVAGITLRNKPSPDGEMVGLVIGLADVIVAGRSRCGYTPVLVHGSYMMDITSPRPEVDNPVPLGVLNTPTPLGRLYPEGTTPGWAYTAEMIVIGQNAIAGPMGLNLRAEPCQGADNLGFIPSGADLVITGRPEGDYTPVLIKNDTLQLPFISPGVLDIPVTATPPGVPIPVEESANASAEGALMSPTPGPTSVFTLTPTPSATP